jgi:hypothetical protein
MRWVIQTNIFAEEGFGELIAALDRFALHRAMVKVVPFAGTLELVEGELPEQGEPAIVMGSYALARVAERMQWKPGAFLDNLDGELHLARWGEHMLNADARVYRFEDVPERDEFFLRPVHDTKAFTGTVIDWPSYCAWRDRVRAVYEADAAPLIVDVLTIDTPVMVGSCKQIHSETRVWIVDGEPVTWSGYKRGGRVHYLRPHEVDARIPAFAGERATEYSPNRAYVLDVADTPEGLKILEVNNLNSAGWYRADLQKLVARLDLIGQPERS